MANIFVLTTVIMGALAFMFFMLWRNELVYQMRIKILHNENINLYDSLPSYEKMLFKFWIPLSRYERERCKKCGK